jgi:hypothetical protein
VTQNNWDDGTPVDRRSGGRSVRKQSEGEIAPRDAAVSRQAQRVISTELLAMEGVVWVRVSPAPDAMRLRVEVFAVPEDLELVASRLGGRRSALRKAVAAGVRRRKAPDLMLVILPYLCHGTCRALARGSHQSCAVGCQR